MVAAGSASIWHGTENLVAKKDVKIEQLLPWDAYARLSVSEALPSIYERATASSAAKRRWYWDSIRPKRQASVALRVVSYLLLVGGAVAPLLAGLSDSVSMRLSCTQLGVAGLAVAGLVQGADRVFGWSSGWLRYMTTVTAMETVTRKFELEWASYMLDKKGAIDDGDKRPLFDMAKRLEDELGKLQGEETDRWVTEFNSSMTLLNDLIKSQRESAEKAHEAARSAVAAQEKAQQTGGIEVTLVHKAALVPVKIAVDDGDAVDFTGHVWAMLQVRPGLHKVRVSADTPAPWAVEKVANVLPGGFERLEIRLV